MVNAGVERLGKDDCKCQEVAFKQVTREGLTEKVIFEPSHRGGEEGIR